MKVGVVGLGNLGTPIAKNLHKAGFPVTVHDLRPEAARKLLDRGVNWGARPLQCPVNRTTTVPETV